MPLTEDPSTDSKVAKSKIGVRGGVTSPQAENAKTPGNRSLPGLGNAFSDPYGTRTRVAGVKGRSPRPLDEGAAGVFAKQIR